MPRLPKELKIPFKPSKCFLGLDPGKSGGVSIINEDGSGGFAWGMGGMERTDVARLFRFLATFRPIIACVEQVGPRPRQDVRSVFTFGQMFERVAWVECFGIPMTQVLPRVWQKALNCPLAPKLSNGKTDRPGHKRNLRDMAKGIFPDIKVTLETADALLIGEYARRTYNQVHPVPGDTQVV